MIYSSNYAARVVEPHEQGLMSGVFYKMQDTKADWSVIYDLERRPNIMDWQGIMQRSRLVVLGNDNGLGAACWVNGFTGKAAFVHFCIFEPAHALELGTLAMDVWRKEGLLRSLIGITPITYRHVWPLMEGLGFRKISNVPEACYFGRYKKYKDGLVSQLDL